MGCNCKKKKNSKKLKIFKGRYMLNFLKFMIKNILSGFKHVSYEEYKERLQVCQVCPFLHHKERRCTDCGCWVDTKARFKSEDCPQNYWRKLDVRIK
jgi:hypothetical protein